MNVYEKCPVVQNERFQLRPVKRRFARICSGYTAIPKRLLSLTVITAMVMISIIKRRSV